MTMCEETKDCVSQMSMIVRFHVFTSACVVDSPRTSRAVIFFEDRDFKSCVDTTPRTKSESKCSALRLA